MRVPMFGRNAELLELETFLNAQPAEDQRGPDLLWWLWTGPGGMGKSRLAYEFCQRVKEKQLHLNHEDWTVGFLTNQAKTSFNDWAKWQITGPTLIVVDYVESAATQIGEALKSIYHADNDDLRKYPIRFLLLERDTNDRWVDQFTAISAGVREAVEATAYRLPDQAQARVPSRELKPLDDDSLWNSFAWIASEQGGNIANDDELLTTLKELDAHHRPFYAAIAGLAVQQQLHDQQHPNLRQWDQAKLMEFVIHREVEHWRNGQPKVDDKHANLLTLATLCGGLPDKPGFWTQAEFIHDFEAILPCDVVDQAQRAALAEFAGSAVQQQAWLPDLEPDILSEIWVLSRLAADTGAIIDKVTHKPYTDPENMVSDTQALIRLAWVLNYYNVGIFCIRCINDFPHHNQLLALLSIVPNETSNPIPGDGLPPAPSQWSTIDAWGYMVVDSAHRLVALENDTTSNVLLDLLKKHIDHRHDHEKRAVQLHIAYAQALFNRAVAYEELTLPQYELAIKDYSTVIEMEEAPNDYRVKALINRGSLYEQLEPPQSAQSIEDCTTVINMRDASADQLTRALINRGMTYGQLSPSRTDLEIQDYTAVIEMEDTPANQYVNALCYRAMTYAQTDQIAWAGFDFATGLILPQVQTDCSEQNKNTFVYNACEFCDKQLNSIEQATSFLQQYAMLPIETLDEKIRPLVTLGALLNERERSNLAKLFYQEAMRMAQEANDSEQIKQMTLLLNNHGDTE